MFDTGFVTDLSLDNNFMQVITKAFSYADLSTLEQNSAQAIHRAQLDINTLADDTKRSWNIVDCKITSMGQSSFDLQEELGLNPVDLNTHWIGLVTITIESA